MVDGLSPLEVFQEAVDRQQTALSDSMRQSVSSQSRKASPYQKTRASGAASSLGQRGSRAGTETEEVQGQAGNAEQADELSNEAAETEGKQTEEGHGLSTDELYRRSVSDFASMDCLAYRDQGRAAEQPTKTTIGGSAGGALDESGGGRGLSESDGHWGGSSGRGRGGDRKKGESEESEGAEELHVCL